MKETSAEPGEPVEGEIEALQSSQVVQLFTLQPREKVVAEDMIFAIFVRWKRKEA